MAKFQDLTGKQFGRLKAIKYAGNRKWLCECSCESGSTIEVSTYSLTHGLTTSCGCVRKETLRDLRLEDLTGQHFGDWTVIRYKGNSMWECKCSCDTVRDVKAQSLKSGASKSCGHATTGFKDFTGKVVGEYLVLKKVGANWECECTKCGLVTTISHDSLLDKKPRKCECSKIIRPYLNLKGQRFGTLTALEYLGHNKWACKCDCGNISVHYSHNLRRSNNTISCGCASQKGYTKAEITSIILKYLEETGEFPTRFELGSLLDRAPTSVVRYIDKFNLDEYVRHNINRSEAELELEKRYIPSSITDRTLLNDGTEIDLYFSTQRIGIEFNGIYWHSELFKDKKYHQNKSLKAIDKHIRLIHIFEYEWVDNKKKEKLLNQLDYLLGIKQYTKVYARNTIVREITNQEAIDFCNKYHFQNGINSVINLGCFLGPNLIGVMTFSRPRFSTEQWELMRLAYLPNVKIIGGTKKLFNYFIKRYSPSSIVSYCNISKFDGLVYKNIGFVLDSITEPNYVWSNSSGDLIYSRYQTQKHKLIKAGYDNLGKTEDEIMTALGYYKIYDCGNYKFTWKG